MQTPASPEVGFAVVDEFLEAREYLDFQARVTSFQPICKKPDSSGILYSPAPRAQPPLGTRPIDGFRLHPDTSMERHERIIEVGSMIRRERNGLNEPGIRPQQPDLHTNQIMYRSPEARTVRSLMETPHG